MPAPTITPLPTPPSRSTDPTNFAIEADAFVAALPEFATDANAQASYLDGLATAVDADAAAAAASATAAEGFADDAEASAAGAAAAADVSAWVSGTTYAIGDCVFSPVDFQTYRRKTNGAGTTDPSGDIVNWVAITGAGGGGSVTAVATGALSNGTKVVLNSDGTVSAIAKTITALNPPTAGTLAFAFGTSSSQNIATAYDKKRKLVFVAAQTTSSTTVYFGKIINNQIVFDGSTAIATTGTRYYVSMVYDYLSEQLIIAFAQQSDTYGYVVVGDVFYDVNGWRYRYGSQVAFNSGSTSFVSIDINPNNGTCLIAYQNSNPINVKVGTVGFRTMTFGAAATVTSSGDASSVCYIGNNNFAVAYRSYVATTGLNAAVVSISGTTATVNTAVNLSGFSTTHTTFCACDISAQRLAVTYVNGSNSIAGVYVASISGTTLTAGGSANLTGTTNQRVAVSFNPDAGRFVFAYISVTNNSRLYAVSGLITGTSIALGTAGPVNTGATTTYPDTVPSCVFRDDVGDVIAAAYLSNNTSAAVSPVAVATITSNLTADNFIGISDAAYLNGANATIQVVSSVDDAQSGLTPGRRYFVGEDGTLKLQSYDWEPVVYAGTALSATRLLIKG